MRTSYILLAVIAVVTFGLLAACAQNSTHMMVVTDADPAMFADNAFPPVLPDDADHRSGTDSWFQESCLSCHEGGANNAPVVVHEGMAEILLDGKCRSCHTTSEGNG